MVPEVADGGMQQSISIHDIEVSKIVLINSL